MLNRVVLVGRLTKDPELRKTTSGVDVSTFTLAVNRNYTNNKGGREADFINVVTFRNQANNVNKYLSKGQLAGVDGRIQTRSYENNEGRRVFLVEVVAESVQFLETKNTQAKNNDTSMPDHPAYSSRQEPQQSSGLAKNNQRQAPKGDNPFANAPVDISDDDLPF